MLDAQITQTFIGQEYGWDHVSDADPAILRTGRESMQFVIDNPSRFPNADFAKAERIVREIDEFFFNYGYLLNEYATDVEMDEAFDMALARDSFA